MKMSIYANAQTRKTLAALVRFNRSNRSAVIAKLAERELERIAKRNPANRTMRIAFRNQADRGLHEI